MDDWQPIETAPKDERFLTCISGMHQVQICAKTEDGSLYMEDTGMHFDDMPTLVRPTHWMPLPKPPMDED